MQRQNKLLPSRRERSVIRGLIDALKFVWAAVTPALIMVSPIDDYLHSANEPIIHCNEVMTVQTTIIVIETHSPEAGDTQPTIQQAVTDWLTKELYK